MKASLLLSLALVGCAVPESRSGSTGIAESRWAVIAINDRATPGAGYFVNFADRAISARFGCNSIGGTWRLNGDHLAISELIQTEMACPEPAMTFERSGSAILVSNMRIEPIDSASMRLVSEAGSIDLRRAN